MKAIIFLIPSMMILLLAASPLTAQQGDQDLSKLFPKQMGGLEGFENIPTMLSTAAFVCKGEIISVPEPTFSRDETPRMTGIAYVRIDRCFKGDLTGKTIGVQVDKVLEAAGQGWHAFRLRSAEYDLLFLNPWNDRYIPANQFYGALPVSRMSAPQIADSDPRMQLESDLRAGLQDRDQEAVLNNIQRLGNMGQLHSNTELRVLANSPDPLTAAHALEALLKLKDYSVFPAVVKFLSNRPEPPIELKLPQDRLLYMQKRIVQQIRLIRDPSLVPFLENFALSSKPTMKKNALEALGYISAPSSAAVFLKLLDDPEPLIEYGALKGLASLAGPAPRTFAVPSINLFLSAPREYVRKCHEWWRSQGQREMELRITKKLNG